MSLIFAVTPQPGEIVFLDLGGAQMIGVMAEEQKWPDALTIDRPHLVQIQQDMQPNAIDPTKMTMRVIPQVIPFGPPFYKSIDGLPSVNIQSSQVLYGLNQTDIHPKLVDTFKANLSPIAQLPTRSGVILRRG